MLRRFSCCALLLATFVAVVGTWQSPRTAFDVVSVKRFAREPEQGRGGSISILPGGRFSAPAATLRALIAAAYGLLDIQVVDSARLLWDEPFELEGRTSPDVTVADARAMLRTLLAERFGLVAHRETRELPVYIVSLATAGVLGTQLRRSGENCAPVKGPAGVPPPPPPPGPPPQNVGRALVLGSMPLRCGSLVFSSTSGAHWSIREITMNALAARLVGTLGRPVLDRTGLDGFFDLDLTYTADNPTVDATDAPNAPSLITAMREQLGLRLESTRAPVEVLVIDGVRPPAEN